MAVHLGLLPHEILPIFVITIMFLLLPLGALGMIFFFISKCRGQRNLGQHEQVQLDEMVRMLEKMEERITNLETVLMQRSPPRQGADQNP